MTDQRNRVTTDPGLGPIEREHHSTLRSIVAAEPVAADPVVEVTEVEEEDPGAPVYYRPTPLHAVSDHKTLELETVKLSKDIDPRKLPTELKLRRPVLQVMPASDPNWPVPSPSPAQHDAGWPPPQYDSGWPPPETVLTTSQPPQAARRRSFIPLVLLVVLAATLLLVLGARRRSAVPAIAAQAARPAMLSVEPSPKVVEAVSSAPRALANSAPASEASASERPAASATNAPALAASAEATASGAPARPADTPHHPTFKPVPPSIGNGRTLSPPPTAKPKRAIY